MQKEETYIYTLARLRGDRMYQGEDRKVLKKIMKLHKIEMLL